MHPVNFSSPFVDATKLGPTALPLLHDALILDPVLDISGPHEILELVSAYATMDDQKMCTGSLNLTTCSMVSAIGEYDVEIQNDTFKILNAHNPRILSVSNNTAVSEPLLRFLFEEVWYILSVICFVSAKQSRFERLRLTTTTLRCRLSKMAWHKQTAADLVSLIVQVDRDMIDRLDVYPSTLGGFYFFMYENYGKSNVPTVLNTSS